MIRPAGGGRARAAGSGRPYPGAPGWRCSAAPAPSRWRRAAGYVALVAGAGLVTLVSHAGHVKVPGKAGGGLLALVAALVLEHFAEGLIGLLPHLLPQIPKVSP